MTKKADNDDQIFMAMALSTTIQPLLAGQPQYVQGAALADLFSLWIAGHFVPGKPDETRDYRVSIVTNWVETVWKLVPASEKELLEKMEAQGHG